MCEGNEDNDCQKHTPLSPPSARKQQNWVFVKWPWAGLSAPAAALPGGAAVQGCWFLYSFKHAQLVSQLEFPVDFSR